MLTWALSSSENDYFMARDRSLTLVSCRPRVLMRKGGACNRAAPAEEASTPGRTPGTSPRVISGHGLQAWASSGPRGSQAAKAGAPGRCCSSCSSSCPHRPPKANLLFSLAVHTRQPSTTTRHALATQAHFSGPQFPHLQIKQMNPGVSCR